MEISQKNINSFKELYREFFDTLLKDNTKKTEEICSFFMQRGKSYGTKNPKCLFVGKATNGWVAKSKNVDELFDQKNENRIINRDDEIEWVEKLSGNKGYNYNTNKSAFWRVIKNVSSNLFGQEEWYKFIAWTNIYKFAPENGNPDSYLQKKQRDVCNKILDMEIACLKPDVIIFLTSDWELFYNDHLNVKKENGNNFYEWDGCKTYFQKVNDILYIHSMHPQGKKEENHEKIILKIIKEEI
jgi:hypothetical protein